VTGLGALLGVALAAPNLILVSIDGMRADRAGFEGVAPSPTPTLDRLSADGLRCAVALSESNESLFSHAALLTGRHVSELGRPNYRHFTLPDEALLLPEVLGLYGYSTAAFVAGGHVKGAYGFNQGFSVYNDEHDFGAFYDTVPPALAWIDDTALAPWFVFLHGYDAHRPYQHAGLFNHVFGADYDGDIDSIIDRRGVERILDGVFYADFPHRHFWHEEVGEPILDPDGYARLRAWAADHEGRALTDADQQHLRDHYDSGLLAADLQLGRLEGFLRATSRWDDTLLLITSDHGEDLGDHGLYNHRSSLTDSTTRVPLLVVGGALPESLRGSVLPGPCSALDVVPTLLSAAGATPPAGLGGQDLLAEPAGHDFIIQEGVLPMLAVRSATHRLVVQGLPIDSPLLQLMVQAAPIEAPTFTLYDLRVDPGEQRDVRAAQPEVALVLRAALLGWLKERQASEHLGTPQLDPEFEAMLRSRGYW
jgi:arylsulfatase A-like enzyme